MGDAGYGRFGEMDGEIYGGSGPAVRGVMGARAVGDPGLGFLLGPALKFLGKKILPQVSKLFRRARPAIGGAIVGTTAVDIFRPPGGRTLQGPFPPQQVPTPGTVGAIQRLFPGGASGMQPGIAGPPPRGYRLNKTGYFVERDKGRPEQGGVWVPPQSRYVRYRHNNPANARKTSRAISQIERAKKYQKDLNRITVRKKC